MIGGHEFPNLRGRLVSRFPEVGEDVRSWIVVFDVASRLTTDNYYCVDRKDDPFYYFLLSLDDSALAALAVAVRLGTPAEEDYVKVPMGDGFGQMVLKRFSDPEDYLRREVDSGVPEVERDRQGIIERIYGSRSHFSIAIGSAKYRLCFD